MNQRGLKIALMLLAAVLLSGGCRMRQAAPRPAAQPAARVIAEPQGRLFGLLSSFDPADTKGVITILDEPARCFALSERLVKGDDFDNVDAAQVQDLLPDFAGETISAIIDLKYTPYSRFTEAQNIDALREVAANSFIAAVDTVCCLGPYDHDARSWKPSSKLVVVSSPYFCAYGAFDIDTLLQVTGSKLPVIMAQELMIEQVLDAHDGPVRMAFAAAPEAASSGVYARIFKEVSGRRGDKASMMATLLPNPKKSFTDSLSAPTVPDAFKTYLDAYDASEVRGQLDVLIVDDFSVDVQALRESYREILSSPSEENAWYRKMLSRNFEIVDGAALISRACYTTLRNRNTFTHNISYPTASAWITSPETTGYSIMDYDVSELPEDVSELLERLSPKTARLYVQDQYNPRGN